MDVNTRVSNTEYTYTLNWLSSSSINMLCIQNQSPLYKIEYLEKYPVNI